jgi:hypothetical protein
MTNGYRNLSDQDRFMMYVYMEPMSGCWLWTGARDSSGYGSFGINEERWRASRLAYHFFRGVIPEGAHVLHRCDVRLCVNPNHLFLGDNAINLADMRAKGRQVRGEQQGASRLTQQQVREIKRRIAAGDCKPRIAADFGVTRGAIWHIAVGNTWAWLT